MSQSDQEVTPQQQLERQLNIFLSNRHSRGPPEQIKVVGIITWIPLRKEGCPDFSGGLDPETQHRIATFYHATASETDDLDEATIPSWSSLQPAIDSVYAAIKAPPRHRQNWFERVRVEPTDGRIGGWMHIIRVHFDCTSSYVTRTRGEGGRLYQPYLFTYVYTDVYMSDSDLEKLHWALVMTGRNVNGGQIRVVRSISNAVHEPVDKLPKASNEKGRI